MSTCCCLSDSMVNESAKSSSHAIGGVLCGYEGLSILVKKKYLTCVRIIKHKCHIYK